MTFSVTLRLAPEVPTFDCARDASPTNATAESKDTETMVEIDDNLSARGIPDSYRGVLSMRRP
jgi:hypothetical protein